MKIGDLVQRKITKPLDLEFSAKTGRYGVVVSRYYAGKPIHACVEVFWAKSGKVYGIAESLLEKVNESR